MRPRRPQAGAPPPPGWEGLGFKVYRNCIGFGSGVLGGFGGFCFCFCNLIFGSGGGLVFGWAGLPLGLAGLSSRTFKGNSKLMKMQFEAKLTQFLFILLLKV